jgi:hypothetical protein
MNAFIAVSRASSRSDENRSAYLGQQGVGGVDKAVSLNAKTMSPSMVSRRREKPVCQVQAQSQIIMSPSELYILELIVLLS